MRSVGHSGYAVLSQLAYRPHNLLYHYPSFGGKEAFRQLCTNAPQGTPRIQWTRYLPHSLHSQWTEFLRSGGQSQLKFREVDALVADFAPFFDSPYCWTPFRPVSPQEAMELCGIQGVLQPVHTRHLYDDHMQRSLARNSFHPAVIRGILGTTNELHGWICQGTSDPWSPAPPSQVMAEWPTLLNTVKRDMPSEAKRLPTCPYGPGMPADVLSAPAIPPPCVGEPRFALPPGQRPADRVARLREHLHGVQRMLGPAAERLDTDRHFALLDACRFTTFHSILLAALPKYLLGDVVDWFPYSMDGVVLCPDLVRLFEFWAVHAAGQATSGSGPHGPTAAVVLVLKEGPEGQMLRFGAADPTSVDLIRFSPGHVTVEVGRVGCHSRLGMLGPLLSGLDIGASVSAGGGDIISVPRPPGIGTITTRLGHRAYQIRPGWRRVGYLAGCDRCAVLADACSMVHSLHQRFELCKVLPGNLERGVEPALGVFAVTVAISEFTIQVDEVLWLNASPTPRNAPEVGVLFYCLPRASSTATPIPLSAVNSTALGELSSYLHSAAALHAIDSAPNILSALPTITGLWQLLTAPCSIPFRDAAPSSLLVACSVRGDALAAVGRLASSFHPT